MKKNSVPSCKKQMSYKKVMTLLKFENWWLRQLLAEIAFINFQIITLILTQILENSNFCVCVFDELLRLANHVLGFIMCNLHQNPLKNMPNEHDELFSNF